MTDWRKELIEAMAKAAFGKNYFLYLKQLRAALTVAEPVIREQADAALREENTRLREILKECADDLEDAVNGQYGEMARKIMPDRYERDMQSVVKARAAIREGGKDE